jgi:hypothetical protein
MNMKIFDIQSIAREHLSGKSIMIVNPEIDFARVEQHMMAIMLARSRECPLCDMGYPITIRMIYNDPLDIGIEVKATENYLEEHPAGTPRYIKRNRRTCRISKNSRKRNRK